MTPTQFIGLGYYIMSALYVSGVFTAGLVTGNKGAWLLALITAAVACLSYQAQAFGLKLATWWLWSVSLFMAVAGLVVLAGWP